MCGLAGIVGTETASRDALNGALDAIRHRGPDELGIWAQDGVGLAHARLSIIDRAHGQQPVVSADGRYVVVFNGEIYNHDELRQDLVRQGYPLRTTCDTEVLPYLYAAHGPAMVERLRGMFAIAIVDLHDEEVFLARDGFGKKPLYVASRPGSVAFASTLDGLIPLLASPPSLDPQTIAEYLVLQYVPDDRSPWEGVEKVRPGTWLRWRAGHTERGRHWSPPRSTAPGQAPETEIGSLLRGRIRDAVERRLESEVPLGVFLSGGLDSSVVVAEMAKLGHCATTYSVGFDQDGLDERPFAQLVASRFKTDHHVLVPDADVSALFSRMTTAYDEPFADSSALATLAVAQAAREHVTVVLTGDGGDELFGGYDRYRALALGLRISATLGPLARPAVSLAHGAAHLTGSRKLSAATSFVRSPWAGYRDHMFHFAPGEVGAFLSVEGVDPWAPVRRMDGFWGAMNGQPWVPWVDAQTYLPDDLLTKMDRATMAFGVEARSPLLDEDLWSFVAGIPPAMLIDGRVGKKILRRAYRGLLPEPILSRAKQGFGVPIAAWMRTQLRPAIQDLLLCPSAPVGGLLRPDVTRRLVKGFLDGNDRLATRTWSLLALAGWHAARPLGSLPRGR